MAYMLAHLVYRMLKFGHDYVDRGTQSTKPNTNTNDCNESQNRPLLSICNSFFSQELSVKFLESGRQHVSNCEGGLMPPYLPSADVTRELPLLQKRRQMRSGI
jgi:hypothetical protein